MTKAQSTTGAKGGFKAKPTVGTLRNNMKYKVNTTSTTARGVIPIKGATTYPAEPSIYFTREAWVKQCHLVAKCAKEVGWFALVDHDPEYNSFTITELVIPCQEVTAAETDIGKEDLADAAMELIEQGKDTGKMYAWFHSHVNMGVSPSGQDEYQVEDFLEDLADQPEVPAFIRGIQNKRGELKLDVYYIQHGVAYQNLDFDVIHDDDPQWYKDIEGQIKTKVTEKTYHQYGGNYGGSGGNRQTTGKSHTGGQGSRTSADNVWGDGRYSGYNDLDDYDYESIYEEFSVRGDTNSKSEEVRTTVAAGNNALFPMAIECTFAELNEMDSIYLSPEGLEVLLDAKGKLWICDAINDVYDYEEYTDYFGEVDGDTFGKSRLPAVVVQ